MLAFNKEEWHTPPTFMEVRMATEEELEKKRVYMRAWYAKNPEKMKGWSRRYALANPEKRRAWNRVSIAKARAASPGKALSERQRYRDRDPVRYLFLHAKARAKKCGIVFTLTRDDIVIPEFCPVLGMKLTWGIGRRASANRDSPSVDRIVGELGYVSGNVCIISNRANHLKNNATPDELLRITDYAVRETARVRRELG
jgi:hypothetical protein